MGGEPADTEALVRGYTEWLRNSDVPKLFVRATPGAILSNEQILKYVRAFRNRREVMVFGSHYVQEISPHAIGRALAEWMTTLA